MRHRWSVVLVVVAVGVVGCGSSSPAITPAAYRVKVDKLCAADNAAIKALPGSASSTTAGIEKQVSIANGTLASIRRLKVPTAIGSRVDAWLADVGRSSQVATAAVHAVIGGETAQARSDAAKLQSLNRESNTKAAALGLPDCAEDVKPSGSVMPATRRLRPETQARVVAQAAVEHPEPL